MLNDEITAAVARFFDGGRGPTHDELSRLFRRVGLQEVDPIRRSPGENVGKMKRVREVLSYATDMDRRAGAKLVKLLVETIRAAGGFRPTSESYAGSDVIDTAREAFRREGYALDPDRSLRPLMLENLDSAHQREALQAYVRRAQVGAEDAALVVGTGKDLLEATARHVLEVVTGSYPTAASFPATLYLAFERLSLSAPPAKAIDQLATDGERAVEEALYLLGVAVNRLRNQQGVGHGRPCVPKVRPSRARLLIKAMGVVSELLLEQLEASANRSVSSP